MTFHEVRFPANLSFGSVGGPERRTEIVALTNGFEERNAPWAHSRRRYDAGLGLRSLDDVALLVDFFEARLGQMHAFRWKDWTDFKSCKPSLEPGPQDQPLGQGDGLRRTFPLQKAYASGPGRYVRPITKPVRGSILIALAGDTQKESIDFAVDYAVGLVSFTTAPGDGATVTAGFEFDVPVRFDADRIEVSVSSFQAGHMPDVPVLEVRL